jgi:hypothetical protein
LGSARSFVINQRNYVNGRSAGRDGGRGGRNDAGQRDANTRNASATQTAQDNATDTATQVSDITDRGSQNGRGFVRGAYGNNNA